MAATIDNIIWYIQDYLEYNVYTVIELINADELIYPVITICNANQISTPEGLNLLKQIFNNSGFNYESINSATINNIKLNKYLTSYLYPYELFYQLPIQDRRNLTLPIEKMFVDGSLNDRNITSNDFKWIFNPYYGNCYQLNLDSSLKTESILNQIELKFN